jgi:hypothetical protein
MNRPIKAAALVMLLVPALIAAPACRKKASGSEIYIPGLCAIIDYSGWHFTEDARFIGKVKKITSGLDASGLIKAAVDDIGVQFFLFEKPVGTAVLFNTNISFIIDSAAAPGTTLKDYVTLSRNNYGIFFKKHALRNEEYLSINGFNCALLETFAAQDVGDRTFNIASCCLITEKEGRFYVFTGTSLKDEYPAKRKKFIKVFDSLRAG